MTKLTVATGVCVLSLALLACTAFASDMTFDECARLNRGEVKDLTQTFKGTGGRLFIKRTVFDDTYQVNQYGNANVQITHMEELGWSSPLASWKEISEKASGTKETSEAKSSFGVELGKVLSTPGTTVYNQIIMSRSNDAEFKEAQHGKVAVNVSPAEPMKFGGCEIQVIKISTYYLKPEEDGTKLGERYQAYWYAPALRLTLKRSEFFPGKEMVLMEIQELKATTP